MMTNKFQSQFHTTLAAILIGFGVMSIASAQSPYSDPYLERAAQRSSRAAYLAGQRAKASMPVNYTFPVRADISTAYNAAAYSPQYQYSRYASPYRAYPNATANTPYQNAAYQSAYQNTYRPTATPYAAAGNAYAANPYQTERPSCSSSPYLKTNSIPATNGAYYRAAAAASGGEASPYYVGTSLGGPPKVYPKDEPFRNLFRYLIP